MTTTAPEVEKTSTEKATKVDLKAEANGSAPKRRGRPPGSKNKPKAETTTRRTRRATPAAPKTTTTTSGKDVTAHAILIENGIVNVLLVDGSSFKIDGPVYDRR